MKRQRNVKIALYVLVGVLGLLVTPVRADVTPGETIDKTNWQKAEGLLPDPVLNYVKKGDFVLHIGKLNYDPVWEPEFLKASEANAGKYDIDEDGNVVDPTIGKRPEHIFGFPFPKIDPKDPKAAIKIAWNRSFAVFKDGQNYFEYSVEWVGRGGFERRIVGVSTDYYFDGRPNKLSNPDATELKEASNVSSPASVEGFIQLTWRYMDNRPDSVWSYVPAMRRTRQLSSVNRSDPFLGSDITSDDAYVWYGKNQSMTWKLVGQQDILVQTQGPDPVPLVAGPEGDSGTSWATTKDNKGAIFGYETPNWKGAPWAMTNMIWVKRPVWVVEIFPKDPYYSYGRQVIYADRENALLYYKVNYNRAGEYWKLSFADSSLAWSPDGKHRYYNTAVQMDIDDKSDHAGVGCGSGTHGDISEYNTARVHPENFSVDNLLKFGK
ncbi:MAG: DUF1329 domain-containing protein [Candidatus Binatia bacterium]